jgi:putative IMPACT (imprinted ancient) family translation regulator
MLFSDSYFTISRASEALVKEKGSKFMGFAFPVSSETEIRERLAELKKSHSSASHHCYAWRLGPDKAAYRANDDGEPSNSAGKPNTGA